jgi:uncharacterized protein (TIGR04141 family)
MAKREPPMRTISVYLLRRDIISAKDALRDDPGQFASHRVKGLGEDAVLYVRHTPPIPPKWAEFFDDALEPPLKLARPGFAAVLFVKASSRRFALAFGSGGRWLLRLDSYERNFGLRVAVNSVDPDQIRSVQSRTFIDTALQVRRQVAEASNIVGLEMDVQRDLLTNLEGSVRRDALGKRLAGADAARLTHAMEAREVKAVCSQLLRTSKADTYKSHYGWIDWIAEVTDPDEMAEFEEEALGLLFDLELERFDVYPPEMVSEDIVDFGTSRNTTVMEPTRKLLERTIRRIDAPDPTALGEALRHLYISARNEEGEAVKRWSWWECLYYEHRTAEQAAVLDRGAWFRVRGEEARAVNDFAAALTPSGLALPDAGRAEIEKNYNLRVASERSDLMLLDSKLIQPITGESRIEICDLFSEAGHLIHVKRRKGGSSGLSHLFGQAFVSSELLLREQAFATQMRSLLGVWANRVSEPPKAASHPVVLAVVLASESTGEGARALPFFSKVFMRQNVQTLQTMGFTVHYDEIPAQLTQTTP